MFNKKKGFTLVEVLAILVILAIIALITVPSVLKITTESKINSIESSAQMLAKAAEDYYSSQIIGGTELEKVNLTDETLIYRGTRPTMGYAYFDEEGRAYIKMYYDGYCVVRNYTGELELQQTEPTDCSIADMVSIVLYYDGGQIITNDKWSINDNYASTVLEFANALTEIPTITKPGYTFLGWWDEDNKQVNLAAPVTKNIKATAKWQANTYTITLDTTGGVVDGGYDNEREVVFNTEYGELPEPTKFGYIFQGWYTAGGLRVEADTILSNPSNHTIYATWEAIKYTVTLNSNGGVFDPHMDWTINGNIASRVTIHGTYYNDLLIPINTGYTFNGWYTEGGIKVDSSVMVEGELSLYAKWTPNNYVITFKYNDGVTGDTTKEVTYDSTYGILPTPTRAGYTFTGWLTSGGSVVTKDTIVKVTSNTNLYAQWAVNTYTITFKYNDNKTNDTEKTVTYDKTYGTLPNPTRAGYTFLGWYTALTSGTKIEASQTVKTAKDQILYAIWSQNTYTITFNSNGGTIPSGTNWTGSGTNATKQVIYDNTYGELPNPTKTGYTFNGWATSGGAVINASDTVKIIASTTLYAQWGANSYLVTFDANGGSVTIQNSSIEFNKTYGSKVGELPTPTRTGYTFQGWYSAKTSGTVVTKETTMNTASNHSVYARWQANTYTVTFNRTNFGNGEVVYFNPVTAKVCDASEAVSTTGTKTGCMKWYAFLDDGGDKIKLLLDHNTTAKVAWNADSTGTTPVTALAQLNSDVSSWNSTIKSTARLITATEINKIAPAKQFWDVNKYKSYYNFHTGTSFVYTGAAGTNTYAWLFDNTKNCTASGCYTSQSDNTGFWTNDYAQSKFAWVIGCGGGLTYSDVNNANVVGIRPIIIVDKSLLLTAKEVTYDSTYGTLPELSKHGYTFTGWYTTGGVKADKTTKVIITSNQTLYPQWNANNYTLTYDSNDGAAVSTQKTITYNSTYGELPITTRTGYTFYGWYKSNSYREYKIGTGMNIYEGGYPIFGPYITLNKGRYIAKINGENLKDLKFDVAYDHGTIQVPIEHIDKTNTEIIIYFTLEETIADLEIRTYGKADTFTYNYLRVYEEINATSNIDATGNQTLIANWIPNTYTLTATLNGGTMNSTNNWKLVNSVATKDIKYDREYDLLPNVIKTNYKLFGWFNMNEYKEFTYGKGMLQNIDVTYGPYTPLTKGKYVAKITGENLANLSYDIADFHANVKIPYNHIEKTNTEITIYFTLDIDRDEIEIRTLGTKGEYTFNSLKIYKEVTENSLVNLTQNHTITAQWYKEFANGTIVYYDVTTGKSCTNYHVDNSITGYNGTTTTKTTNNQNGCLKFYSFLSETTDYVKLFLDHDTTTYTCWNNTGGEWNTTNVNGPSTAEGNVLSDLYLDTKSWVGTNTPKNYSLNQTSAQEGYANYTINYSGYKARLITAQEIADIVGASSGSTGFGFNEKNAPRVTHSFYFDGFGFTAADWQIKRAGINVCGENEISPCTKEVSEYGWLYDRSGTDCVTYGCYNNSDVNTNFYWTATATTGADVGAWRLYKGGFIEHNYVWANGSVRPVIEVNKSNLK